VIDQVPVMDGTSRSQAPKGFSCSTRLSNTVESLEGWRSHGDVGRPKGQSTSVVVRGGGKENTGDVPTG